MTHYEFFNQVIALANDNTEMVEIANAYLASLAKKSAKAKEKRLEKSIADTPLMRSIVEYLTTHKSALASELATACEISTPKVVALCNKMIDAGTITVVKVKIPKVGERNSYSLITGSMEDSSIE